mmetsp:Transcript_15581/g.24898  ORF Transcript_15581/g.24898 Transcript_15581/m.24898 type:complete len:212 (-) Transcript_15581:46-681(-)
MMTDTRRIKGERRNTRKIAYKSPQLGHLGSTTHVVYFRLRENVVVTDLDLDRALGDILVPPFLCGVDDSPLNSSSLVCNLGMCKLFFSSPLVSYTAGFVGGSVIVVSFGTTRCISRPDSKSPAELYTNNVIGCINITFTDHDTCGGGCECSVNRTTFSPFRCLGRRSAVVPSLDILPPVPAEDRPDFCRPESRFPELLCNSTPWLAVLGDP